MKNVPFWRFWDKRSGTAGDAIFLAVFLGAALAVGYAADAIFGGGL